MKVIIIEDEKPSARRLQRMLKQLNVEANVMLHSVEEAIYWFQNNPHPDLIFLDIQLSDGVSFKIFETVTVNSSIIFTTAYDEYALKAFKLNSVDYLLKPIDDNELKNAVDKFKLRQPQQTSVDVSLKNLKQLLNTAETPSYKTRFSIKVGQQLKLINTTDIECFYSEHKGTYAFTQTANNYLLDDSLDDLEQLVDPKQFFRVSRKFLIHIKAINSIVSYTNSRLQITLNTFKDLDIIVSRERVKAFKHWLG